ncbi:hypothetical protein V6Z11_A09G135100 [Gossypium hirsutum]
MCGELKTVCVTGASGYIASCLVKQLLLRGYTVKASVRDPAEDRLKLIKANLLEEGSYDFAVEGCEGVFHTASPFYHDVKDPERFVFLLLLLFLCYFLQAFLLGNELLSLYLNPLNMLLMRITSHQFDDKFHCRSGFCGLNMLNLCANSSSIKRVVLTASIAAVTYNGKPRTPDVVDESWFSLLCYTYIQLWHVVSKTMAEDAAWKFSKEKGVDMVAINPGMVIGPLLQPTLNTRAAAVLSLIKGVQTFPNATFGSVNVKDVANAHIQAFEIPSASGRYCLVERVAHYAEVVKFLHQLYPSFQLPKKCADDKPYVPTYQVSKEKARSLGIEFIPLDLSLKETVESLKEKGFVDF